MRQVGGYYIVGDGPTEACGRLPIPLVACRFCHQVPRFSRGLSLIDPLAVLHAAGVCSRVQMPPAPDNCPGCPFFYDAQRDAGYPLRMPLYTVGLLWVGERYYSPAEFLAEARERGVSRRIAHPPKQLPEVVYLAHRKGMPYEPPPVVGAFREDSPVVGPQFLPAVIGSFRPRAVEKIVPDSTPEAELLKLRERGVTPVIVEAGAPEHGGEGDDAVADLGID